MIKFNFALPIVNYQLPIGFKIYIKKQCEYLNSLERR